MKNLLFDSGFRKLRTRLPGCWCLAAVASVALLAQPAAAQSSIKDSYEAQKNLTVSTVRYAEARAATLAFLRRRGVQLQRQEETPEELVAEFALPLPAVPALDSLAAALGYVLSNNLTRQSLEPRLQELRVDIAADSLKLAGLRRRLTRKTDDDDDLQRDAENLETSLRRDRLKASTYRAHQGQVYVDFRLFDEISFPVANSKVNFVNMPGVEVGLLRLENPRPGLSATMYRGYAIKYLFTRGKSYLNLGIYKPTQANPNPLDSAFVNELAIINFGQDFYPRNFGRGRRRYLNLYTCYQIGGFIANRNDEARNEFIFNINPGLGLELVKTKHILLDTKVSYFVPLNRDSRNLRGLLVQGAFNFVF